MPGIILFFIRYSFLSDVLNFETNRNSLRVTTIHDMQRGKDGTVAEFTCITYNKAGESKRNIKIVLRGKNNYSDITVRYSPGFAFIVAL